MTFADISAGAAVFVDANIFVYAFGPDPQLGPPCEELLERIELNDIVAFTSSHVLSDVAHRLMTLEACATFGWPYAGIAQRLKRHAAEAKQLTRYLQAVETIMAIGVQVVPVVARNVLAGAAITRQHGLLSNDALIVALMQENALIQLVSHDADFDRVTGITRYAPV